MLIQTHQDTLWAIKVTVWVSGWAKVCQMLSMKTERSLRWEVSFDKYIYFREIPIVTVSNIETIYINQTVQLRVPVLTWSPVTLPVIIMIFVCLHLSLHKLYSWFNTNYEFLVTISEKKWPSLYTETQPSFIKKNAPRINWIVSFIFVINLLS